MPPMTGPRPVVTERDVSSKQTASLSGGATGAIDALQQRLDAVETLGQQVSQAIESLVDAVVGLQQQVTVPEEAPPANDMAGLAARVAQLEQQFRVQTACADLAHTSRFHPKRPCVVFVGTTYFGCNVKYAWLDFRHRARAAGIEAWFLPQTEAQEAAVRSLGEACFPCRAADWQPEHLSTALSAAVVVTCDHLLNPNPYAAALLAGARHVQLWHGVSIKEIGLRNLAPLKSMSPQFARVLATCGPFSRMVGTSASQEREFRRWFGLSRYDPIGYPRNDVLLREPEPADLLGCDLEALARAREARARGGRVVLYAPTFRNARRGSWIVEAGLERLARRLDQRGDTLVVAMHPVEAPMIPQLAQAVPTARFVTPRTDQYPMLREADVLVTDYSSIMFDYLLLDRPVLLFRPDHVDYVARSRQLHDDKLLDALPGPLLTDVDALLQALSGPASGPSAHAQARHRLRDQLFDHLDGRAAERLAAVLLEEMDLALAE